MLHPLHHPQSRRQVLSGIKLEETACAFESVDQVLSGKTTTNKTKEPFSLPKSPILESFLG
jgi:hypothetical protein